MAAVSLTVSTVKPLGDRIFIKVSESEEKTAGGILLPDSAKEKPQVGEVAQVGPGKLNKDGAHGQLNSRASQSKPGTAGGKSTIRLQRPGPGFRYRHDAFQKRPRKPCSARPALIAS